MQNLGPVSLGMSILAGSLGLALVGCGGSGSSGTQPTGALPGPPAVTTPAPAGTAPSITTPPASQTIVAGLTATFTVVASGSGPLTYQWQDNGTNIAGATGASYTTPATKTQNSGSSYQVIVANSAGSITSNAAILTVTSMPTSAPCAAAPTAPTGLVATASASSVNLNWIAATVSPGCTISSYKVYRSTTSGFTPSSGNLLTSTMTNTRYTDSVLVPSTYYYVVEAIDAFGASLASNQVITTITTGVTLPTSNTPDFGPNVQIFDPAEPAVTIQAAVDSAFHSQLLSDTAQFGGQRFVFLFKPGKYGPLFANLGYYTTLAGLGLNPDDVSFAQGDMNVDSGWNLGDTANATQNFWRSAENMAITPASGTDRWAVSQAAPMRRMHIRGNLTLGPSNQAPGRGFASGGFIADSRIDGQVTSGSQQQWYSRDSSMGGWSGGVWNMVFSGVQGAPTQGFPVANKNTVLATTPVSREKPYLYVDGSGNYNIFVPSLRTNATGTTWPNTPGTSIPMSQFYVASPADSTATLNAALAQGLNLFFTPGVYKLTETLHVTRADTVVTGIGFPTLVPNGGVNALMVDDVDGVKISNLLFDAGTVNSPALVTVGTTGSHVNHAANPSSVQDVFFRIGGAVAGISTTSLIVNSDNTIIDHIWAWRADHGVVPTGWTINMAANGLIVNGDNVLATGLFVEHYQNYEVLWNGNGGETIFFQNEMPYDPPTQAAWRSGANGYAAYKVADTVTAHQGWGMGSYCYFNVNPTIQADHGFEVPVAPGVQFHSLLTVPLGGGTIDNIINGTGGPAQGTTALPVSLVSFP
jgi:hypothetical protein